MPRRRCRGSCAQLAANSCRAELRGGTPRARRRARSAAARRPARARGEQRRAPRRATSDEARAAHDCRHPSIRGAPALLIDDQRQEERRDRMPIVARKWIRARRGVASSASRPSPRDARSPPGRRARRRPAPAAIADDRPGVAAGIAPAGARACRAGGQAEPIAGDVLAGPGERRPEQRRPTRAPRGRASAHMTATPASRTTTIAERGDEVPVEGDRADGRRRGSCVSPPAGARAARRRAAARRRRARGGRPSSVK